MSKNTHPLLMGIGFTLMVIAAVMAYQHLHHIKDEAANRSYNPRPHFSCPQKPGGGYDPAYCVQDN